MKCFKGCLCFILWLFMSFPVQAETPAEGIAFNEAETPVEDIIYNETETSAESIVYNETETPAESIVYNETETPTESIVYSEAETPAGDIVYNEAEMSAEDVVYTEAEFKAWCAEHYSTGGEVFLGDSITLTSPVSVYSQCKIIVNTGPHSLIYNGGMLVSRNFSVIGEGVSKPVVEIYYISNWDMHWSYATYQTSITATGKNGIGGVAVKVSQDNFSSYTIPAELDNVPVTSYGEGAIGIYLAVPAKAYCLNVRVEGENSTAVYAEYDADLYYCDLFSAGPGASDASGKGQVSLHTCIAENVSANVRKIEYRIVDVLGRSLYLPVQQGSRVKFFDEAFTFLLCSTDGEFSYQEHFYTDWTISPTRMDTSELGKYIIPFSLPASYQKFGLESDFPLELIFNVRGPALPCISNVIFRGNDVVEPHADLILWHSYDPTDENVILWRSDNDGASWYDCTDSPSFEWSGKYLSFYYGEITTNIMLQIEVVGLGESNVVLLQPGATGVRSSFGGDRTGNDRVIQDDQTEPEPESESETDTETDTERKRETETGTAAKVPEPHPGRLNTAETTGEQRTESSDSQARPAAPGADPKLSEISNPLSTAGKLSVLKRPAVAQSAATAPPRHPGTTRASASPQPAVSPGKPSQAQDTAARASEMPSPSTELTPRQQSEPQSDSQTELPAAASPDSPRIIQRPRSGPLLTVAALLAGLSAIIFLSLYLYKKQAPPFFH